MKKNIMMAKQFKLCAAVLCLLFSQLSYAGVAVVVHSSSPISSAERKEIRAIFLHKSKKIKGESFVPIDNAKNDMRKSFLKKVLKKSPRTFKSYWTRLVFSGKAPPLKSQSDDASVKKWIGSHNDAIGFIDTKNVDDSVKVIYQVD